MNLHPTPFSGKRRPAANVSSKNETDHLRSAAFLAQSKPKRTFGTKLCGNVVAMVQRPAQKPITAKPWKPSGVSKQTTNPPTKPLNPFPSAGGAKHGSSKKAQHVTFREVPPPDPADDLLLSTPVFSMVPLVEETPYRSAEHCSKCRLDSLETASYWLSQIKLAESTGKHSVSAAFFRLALDCNAQPFICLQNELKHYRDRHESISMGTIWDDLLRDYGFKSDQIGANSGDCDSFDAVIVERFRSEATVGERESVDRDVERLPMDSPLRNFMDGDNLNSNSGRGDAEQAVRIARNKSNFGNLTSNDSSSMVYSGGVGQELGKEIRDKILSNDLLKSKMKDKEKCISTLLNESVRTAEDEKN